MENVNWLKLKLNQKMMNLQSAKASINPDSSSGSAVNNLVQKTHNNIINNYQRQYINPQQLRMNNLASIDRAVYVKNLLNLPKNMVELLVMVQNNGKMPQLNPMPEQNIPQNSNIPNQPQQSKPPTNENVPNRPNHNPNNPNNPNRPDIGDKPSQRPLVKPDRDVFKNELNNQENKAPELLNDKKQFMQDKVFNKADNLIQNTKQHIRHEALNNPHKQLNNAVRNNIRHNNIMFNNMQAQTAEDMEWAQQIQANNQKTQGMTPEELANFKKQLASQLNSNVNLSNVSAFLQKNSKIAMNKMVSMMTMATAQGMTDIKPLQETVNVINASVSASSQNDATQTLKNLMLLYLPWLPLQEGVGFDLEIEQNEETPEADTFIKILITTVNYGNLQATVSLVSTNSVDIEIVCSEKFPKKELFKRLQKDGTQHSMQTVIDIKEQKPQEQLETINPKAKVNLSNVNQINPYLLLMSHAIIRHTIEIDATISIGSQPIDD